MNQSQLDRINELYRKSKAEGLTPEEKEEQARLRGEYVAAIRASLRGELDNMKIQYPDGRLENVKDRYKGGRNGN